MKCDNFLKKISLKNRQRRLNEMFEEEGLTDEILREQLEINKKRNELDLHDSEEEGDDGFVQ